MNVVELALIKQIILGPDSTEIKMILTTPFCPYAGSMIQQVKEQAEIGRRARRQGHPAGRALGPARRRPDVVIEPHDSAEPVTDRDVCPHRRLRRRDAPRRRRHDRAPVRRRRGSPRTTPGPRPTARSTRPWRRSGWPGRSSRPEAPASRDRCRPASAGLGGRSSSGSSASCSSPRPSSRPSPTPGIARSTAQTG